MQTITDNRLKTQLLEKTKFANLFSTDIVPDTELLMFQSGEYIVQNGITPQYLFYLVKGKTKLYDELANGKIALIDFFMAPCFIGEMELFDAGRLPFGVQTINDCYCLALPVKKLKSTLLSDATFLKNICLYLADKNARNIKTASRNQGFTLAQRLAAFILMTNHDNYYQEKHTQVAQYLGVSYRHLLYVIADFVSSGYLTKTEKGYFVALPSALKELGKEAFSE
ncbi:transcriptional regulator YeiL [Secundilactobacillus kimchicus]|uniref:DNA-binding transcriptional activator YeiL n=2 Tax=Secundilactobacillus kimchicus TaxID=528209 RepID=A0A0R1HZ28_9LACO|nr:transcriptional regulator YeiL [Secundilactobacillus kimchicus]KRK48897.1 DNA-binding transcriptional activator YeiL [Secundilactobacillus kimchicus JCM 15530]MBT9671908.1 transcriptional regulator YeiL [Secundilactobacillus kimchicus]